MSTPLVAGTAALLLSLHPDWRRNEVIARLAAHTEAITCESPSQLGKLGDGMLMAGAALAPDFHDAPPVADGDPSPRLKRQ